MPRYYCVSIVVALAAEGGPNVLIDVQQLHTCRELHVATVVHTAVIACSTEALPLSALFKILYITVQPQLLQEAAIRQLKDIAWTMGEFTTLM